MVWKTFVVCLSAVLTVSVNAAQHKEIPLQPLSFEPDTGQLQGGADAGGARYLARGSGFLLRLHSVSVQLEVAAAQHALQMQFLGANPQAPIAASELLPGKSNYIPSSDRSTWRSNVPNYGRVTYQGLYAGIDLSFYGNARHLEYDFSIEPGSDPRLIRLGLTGADSVSIDSNGALLFKLGEQQIRFRKPNAYQVDGRGKRSAVAAEYLMADNRSASFRLGHYDRARTLVIDPVVDYSLVLASPGGLSYGPYAAGVAVDASGNAYVGGWNTAGFYLAKFNASGSEVYNTAIGTSVTGPSATGVAVDSSGRAYLTGYAGAGLPTTGNAYQPSITLSSAFLTVLSADGSTPVYSSYFGGSDNTSQAQGVAVDSSGNAYLTGNTFATTFPTTPGAFFTTCPGGGSSCGFVSKINPAASGKASLAYSTLLTSTGTSEFAANSIAVDSSNNAYITGVALSGAYPVTPGAYFNQSPMTPYSTFLTKLNASGTALVYSAMLGPGIGNAVAVDGSGNAYVAGTVVARDYPATPGSYQTTYPGGFAAEVNPAGTALVYSTFLSGPSSAPRPTGIQFIPTGLTIAPNCASACPAYITGRTNAADLPMINPVETLQGNAGYQAFLVGLSGDGSQALLSSYIGIGPGVSSDSNYGVAVAVDKASNVYVTGNSAASQNLPATNTVVGTAGEAFLMKIGSAGGSEILAVRNNVNFGDIPVGVSSSYYNGSPATVTLQNLGSTAAALNAFVFSPSGLFAETDNCKGTIPAASSCVLNLTYTPTLGNYTVQTGTLQIASNAQNTPLTIGLTGTGFDASYLKLSPATLNFGNQAVGSSSAFQTITVTNIGDRAGQLPAYSPGSAFTVVNDCPAQIAPRASCQLGVQFTPQSAGLLTGTLNNDGHGTNVTVTGTGTEAGTGSSSAVVLSGTTLNFAAQAVGTPSSSQIVYVNNVGTEPVTIQGASVTLISTGGSASDFQLSGFCGTATSPLTLAPQSSCPLTVVFDPSAAASETAKLTLSIAGLGSKPAVSLTGTGVADTQVLAFTPGNYIFPDQPVGTAGPEQGFAVYNSGDIPFVVDRVIASSELLITSDGCTGATLAPAPQPGDPVLDYSCGVGVEFSPTILGPRSGTLTFISQASGGPQVLSVAGTGISATGALLLDPPHEVFPGQVKGTTSAATYATLYNTGNSAVQLNSLTTTGDFAAWNASCPIPGSFDAGGGCLISTTFTPTATGERTGTVTLTSSAGTQTLTLSGTGDAATLAAGITPVSIDFGPVQNTSTSSATVYVRNVGTEAFPFTSAAYVTGPYSIVGGSCQTAGGSLNPGTDCSIPIRYSPTGTGTQTGTLTVPTTAGTLSVSLTGVATSTVPPSSFSPPVLTFPQQAVKTSSIGNSPVYFTHGGTTTITINSLQVTAGSANFLIATDNCTGATLSSGAACSFYVTFRPSISGYLTGAATLTDNLGKTYTLALAGYAPVISDSGYFSPDGLSFNSQVIGTTASVQNLALQNSGSEPMTVGTVTGNNLGATSEFTLTPDYCSGKLIPVNGSCYVAVAFTPSAPGNRSGTISIPVTYANGATGTFAATLNGLGQTPVDKAVLAPTSVHCPDTVIDYIFWINYAQQTISLTNSGNRPFTVGRLFGTNVVVNSTTTGDFTTGTFTDSTNAQYAGYDGCSGQLVNPGGICGVVLYFNPAATGFRSGSIVFPVTYAGASSPTNFTATLSGNGVARKASVVVSPSSSQFITQVVGGSSPNWEVPVSVYNNGNVPVVLGLSKVTAGFRLYQDNCSGSTLAVGSACSEFVVFSPTATGAIKGTLTIPDNTGNGSHIVALSGTAIPASQQLAFSQTAVSLGSQTVGTTGPAFTLYLSNQSSTPVTVTQAALGGANASDFTYTDHCTGVLLPANFVCTLTVAFSPSATSLGVRTATITETDSGTGGPRTVTLTGTGIASQPMVRLFPQPLLFYTTNVGATTSALFSVTNSGTANLTITKLTVNNTAEFRITSDGCTGTTIAAQSNCLVTVVFSPALGGTRTGSISVTDNASGSPQVEPLSGSGYGIPKVTLTPGSLTFSNQDVGTTSATQAVAVKNSGTDTLKISSIGVSGTNAADFTETNNCAATLAPAASCTVTVAFSPKAAGSRTASVMLTDNANNVTGSTQSIALSGTGIGVPKAAASTASLTFGSQNVGTTSSGQTITLTNSGSASLSIVGIQLTGSNPGDYAFPSTGNTCTATLAIAASCRVTVAFSPKAGGTRTASVVFTDNSGLVSGSTQSVSLSGAGVGVPNAGVMPPSLTFASQPVGTTSGTQTLTFTNSGSGALAIASIQITGANAADFALPAPATTCSTSLAAGASCTVAVTFTPAAIGTRTASVLFTDNSGLMSGSTQSATLSGTGK